jgi:hypothetical protein
MEQTVNYWPVVAGIDNITHARTFEDQQSSNGPTISFVAGTSADSADVAKPTVDRSNVTDGHPVENEDSAVETGSIYSDADVR